MSRKSSKKNIYFAIVVFTAMILGMTAIAVFVLQPQFVAIADIDAKINDIKGELSSEKENTLSDDIKKLDEQLLSGRRLLAGYIVSQSEAMDLTVDISRIAKLAGVKDLHSTNKMQNAYSIINECQHVREGRMQIEFKSSFAQFAELINLLERNKPVIFVDNFTITRSPDDSSSHEVEMALTFFVGQDSMNDILVSADLKTVDGI